MAAYWTNKGKADLAGGGIAGREFRILLATGAPASAAAAADLNFLTEVVAQEAGFTNYVRKTIVPSVTEDDTNDRAAITAANPSTYTAAGGGVNNTLVGAWIFRRATNGVDTPATDVLWCFLGMTSITTNGGDLTVNFGANGISLVS